MIIWLNGSFGVEKTTTAIELQKKLANSILYDSENIGIFLRDNIPLNYSDFQDYKLWRVLNYEILNDLVNHYENIVVPMTLVNKGYFDEIISNLENNNIQVKHIILNATKETIFKRLDGRADTTPWGYQQVDRCLSAFNKTIFGKEIFTDNLSTLQIVDKILELISDNIK